MSNPFNEWNLRYGGGAAGGGHSISPIAYQTMRTELKAGGFPVEMKQKGFPQPWVLVRMFCHWTSNAM